MDQATANPELIAAEPLAPELLQGADANIARAVTAWDIQGLFNASAVIIRHRNSLVRFESKFTYQALPAATPTADASLLRTSYAIEGLHGQPRRLLWIWSESRGLQAVIKPALEAYDPAQGPITLIPITKTQHEALKAREITLISSATLQGPFMPRGQAEQDPEPHATAPS